MFLNLLTTVIHTMCDGRFKVVSKTHSPLEEERERGEEASTSETARRVLEEYHRKERQMGRNIDTVTRRENGKGRSRGTVAWRRTASYICDYTRRGYTMTGARGGGEMSGGMGCIALYPVLFSIPWVRGHVFSSLTRRARARSFYSRYEQSYPIRAR